MWKYVLNIPYDKTKVLLYSTENKLHFIILKDLLQASKMLTTFMCCFFFTLLTIAKAYMVHKYIIKSPALTLNGNKQLITIFNSIRDLTR